MSSDSDSDTNMCDLTTDVNKYMQRAKERIEKKMQKFKSLNGKSPGKKETQWIFDPQDEEQDLTKSENATKSQDSCSRKQSKPEEPTELPTEKPEDMVLDDVEGIDQLAAEQSTGPHNDSFETRFARLNEEFTSFQQDLSNKPVRKTKRKAKAKRLQPKRAVKNKNTPAPTTVPQKPTRKPVRGIDTACTSSAPVTVTVSSDEETTVEEDVNPVVEVNLLWRSFEEKVFRVRKFDKLDVITKYLVKNYNVNPKLLLFTIDDKEVDFSRSTYASLRLNEDVIIEGGTLPESYLEKGDDARKIGVAQGVRLKVQFDRNKHFLAYLQPNDKMDMLYSRVVEEMSLPFDKFKVVFDGRTVSPSDTLANLDIEQDDVFDVILT